MSRVQVMRLGIVLCAACFGCGGKSAPPPAAPSGGEAPVPEGSAEVPAVGPETSDAEPGAIAADTMAAGETLICQGRHYYFNAGDGTYELTLQEFKQGNKRDATVCIEGSSHNCDRPLIRRGAQQWVTGASWVVNISGSNHIQIWQSEYDDGHASGGSDGNCSDGNRVSAAILTSTNGFSSTIVVRRK